VLTKTASGRVCRFGFSYYRGGKTTEVYIGTWPAMSLADVRAKRDEYRAMLDAGLDRSRDRQGEGEGRAEAIVAQVTGGATVRGLYTRWFGTWSCRLQGRWG